METEETVRKIMNSKFNRWWRPLMAWSYLFICIFDFVIIPLLLFSTIQPDKIIQWVPLTLRGGGLYHMAMLAIVGVTSWGRTQEKMRWNPFGMEVERETFEPRSPYSRPGTLDRAPRDTDAFEFEPDVSEKTIGRRKLL